VLAGGVQSRSDGDQSPVCQCGDDARLMTVRKEGPNTGRWLCKAVCLLAVYWRCLCLTYNWVFIYTVNHKKNVAVYFWL